MKFLLIVPGLCALLLMASSVRASEDAKDAFLDDIETDMTSAKKSEVPVSKPVTEGPNDGMYNFTRFPFYRQTMKGDSFVMFFEDGTPLSYIVEVTWKKVAKYFEDNMNVKIGQVNCLKEDLLCEELGILGYPMIKYYHNGREIESHYISRNTDSLISYVHDKLENPPSEVKGNVMELTNETITKVISTGITFIKFYDPHCGFCLRMERAWKQLSNEDFSDADGPVVIAELNCEKYPKACEEHGCRGFPSIILFMNGEMMSVFTNARNAATMKMFAVEASTGYQPKRQNRKIHPSMDIL